MYWRVVALIVTCSCLAACDRPQTPPGPDGGSPSGQVPVSFGDRLAWNQRAADPVELAFFRYALYIDGNRTSVTASCVPPAANGAYECSALLPAMTPGAHTIEIATFVIDGVTVLESSRSAPLRVIASGGVAASAAPSMRPSTVTTAEQVRLQLTPLVEGLEGVSDLAFAPDGSIFIAERRGTVRLFADGVVAEAPVLDVTGEVRLPDGGLLSIALDPGYADNRLMYVLYAAASATGGEFMLARFRDVNHRFGERAVLLDRVAASGKDMAGALRVGPDHKLYVGLDSAGDLAAASSPGSYNGKVLRVNFDATTPEDQVNFTPVFSADHPQPLAIDWQPSTGHVWVLDRTSSNEARLRALPASGDPQRRAGQLVAYTLPSSAGASSTAFYRGERMPMFKGNLFVAASAAGELLRLRFDPAHPSRVISTERLLGGLIDGARIVAAAPDGALYIASATRLYRLAP